MVNKNQYAIVKWHPSNKEYYTSLGYNFTKMKDSFSVKLQDLPNQSHSEIIVICDYCGKEFPCKYQNYINRFSSDGLDTCTQCKHKKAHDTVQLKYCVDNVFQTSDVKEKSKKTCLQKYGEEYYSQTEEWKINLINLNLEKYGTENIFQSEEIKAKSRNTCLKKYGVPYYTQTTEFITQSKKTQLEKYGGVGWESEIARRKIIQSLKSNNTFRTSKPEKITCDLLIELYGEENCLPSYCVDRYILDCALFLSNCKIDVEYDGLYWHKNKERDNKRDLIIQSYGYKILRIKGVNNPPIKEQLKEALNYLINNNCDFYELNLI